MNSSANQNKRINQSFGEEKIRLNHSSRNMALAKVERLLAEQIIVPFPGQEEPEDSGTVELINLDELVEEYRLPYPVKAVPHSSVTPDSLDFPDSPVFPIFPKGITAPQGLDKGKVEDTPPRKISLLGAAVQIFIMIFVMSLVFIFGVMMGRGHVWESGLGHDVIVWLEQKAGWVPPDGPEIIVKEASATQAPLIPGQSASGVAPEKPDMEIMTETISNIWAGQQWFDENSAIRREQFYNSTEAGNLVQSQPDDPAPSSSQTTPAAENKPTAVTTPAPVAAPAPAPTSTTQTGTAVASFAVQVVSAPDEVVANNMVTKLEGQGFTAYSYRNTNGWWAVRIGHFDSQQKAEKARQDLLNLGYKNPYISRLLN